MQQTERQSIDLSRKPHLIDAVIGNSRMLAALGAGGRMYRLWWPHIDTPQHLDEWRTGIRVDGGRTLWFDSEEDGWRFEGGYESGTNIVHVEASHPECPVVIRSTHFVAADADGLVRHYRIVNNGSRALRLEFIHYSSFWIGETPHHQAVLFDEPADALVHYRGARVFAISADRSCTGFHAGLTREQAESGRLEGQEAQLGAGGALAWAFPNVAPGDAVELTLYLAASDRIEPALDKIAELRAATFAGLHDRTAAWWREWLRAARPCPIADDRIRSLYERSLLVMKLMSDELSGAVIAAPEMDESYARSGGYGYCWGRDAAFIASAFDLAGLGELSEKFFRWALAAQDRSGAWQQRHYHDGTLAPSWGLQIDEGASILWGLWRHRELTGSEWVLSDEVWRAVEAGADFLVRMLDDNGLPKPTHDLWEERVAQHAYSSAAVYGGLEAAARIAEARGRRDRADVWREAAQRVRESISARLWDGSRECHYRSIRLTVPEERYREAVRAGAGGTVQRTAKGYVKYVLDVDPVVDASLLGLAIPFAALDPDDERMAKTADRVQELLWVPDVGGIKRYEDDRYIGGNPWMLTTLWLAQFRIAQGRTEEAERLIEWAIDHQTSFGLLPEQIDKDSGQAAWVVPLTWSHAMFVLAVRMLADSRSAGAGSHA
ncbi:glycoside hydrolase family 15 protein [Thermobacillus sp. ZCTH02-B1]|uniref:glycoside hydrolase family 15 protein n=1 Tax=Thermobacillus sp. ZCTH02-B1 TaxID=1858795 RepID=UPI0025E151F0|nr:glycoside hydrolase family 15 protein [Thermobacillus sp. ZCTH02-B1]